jgi:hypothetical protein
MCVCLSLSFTLFVSVGSEVILASKRKLTNSELECNFARAVSQRLSVSEFCFSKILPEEKYGPGRPRVTRGRAHGLDSMARAWVFEYEFSQSPMSFPYRSLATLVMLRFQSSCCPNYKRSTSRHVWATLASRMHMKDCHYICTGCTNANDFLYLSINHPTIAIDTWNSLARVVNTHLPTYKTQQDTIPVTVFFYIMLYATYGFWFFAIWSDCVVLLHS